MLAEQGAHVVLTYVGNEGQAREAVQAIVAAGRKAEAIRMDVADGPASEQAIADAAKRLGRLDILVSNAGISVDRSTPTPTRSISPRASPKSTLRGGSR